MYAVCVCIFFLLESVDRVTSLKRFIAIAQYCRALGNFNSMMEIVVGLSLGPISRLKQLWKVHTPVIRYPPALMPPPTVSCHVSGCVQVH
jgi:RasGEF domain